MARDFCDEDDVVAFLKTLAEGTSDRHVARVSTTATSHIADALCDALDEAFGEGIADAHADLSELRMLAEALTTTLTENELWLKIIDRIKLREKM